MNKHFAILILLFACTFVCMAQYDISLKVKDPKYDTVYLGYYFLGKTYALDTCVNSKGKYSFKKKDHPMMDGVYFLTDNKGSYLEFIVQGETKLSFETFGNNWASNMSAKGSQIQSAYFDYIKESNKLGEQFKALSSKAENVEQYRSELSDLQAQNDTLKQRFIAAWPDHILSKMLMCSKPIAIARVKDIYDSDGKVDSLAMKKETLSLYRRHFFDNVDLTCDALLRTPKEVFFNLYNNYWDNVIKYDNSDTLIYYVDSLIGRCKPGGEMFKFLVNDFTKRALTDNVMGHDRAYVYMVNKYFKTGKVTWMSPSDVEMNVQRADKYEKILIGKTVPDLACPLDTEDSQWHSLSELDNRYRLLVFWSVECGHCTKEMPQLQEFLENNKDKYNIGIMAVHTEGEIEKMREFCEKYKITFTTCNGLFANYDWREYFDIEKTPVIFVLDKQNKILAKNVPVAALGQVMDLLEKGLLNL